ncbi:MAG TPA: DNA internalization-related competence protein ComEC/Rec2 [Tepidisphaeraceae bacterium]|nr:DNA internalization-related competence protein ComEC/Rec2 [Tepidisphaeraceae bacterium]
MDNTGTPSSSWADVFLRRPILSVAALFIAGIFAHPHLLVRPGLWLATSATLLTGSFLARSREILSQVLLSLCILLAGLAAAQLEKYCYPANHISQFTTDQSRLAQVELLITDPPRVLANPPSLGRLPSRQVARAIARRILTNTGWQPTTGTLLVQINEPHPDLAIAQSIVALGTLDRLAGAMNPGQFAWAAYYREQRILTAFHIAHIENIQILSSPGPSPLDRLRQLIRRALEMGFADASLDHALLRALVLGDADPQLRDVQQDFIRTGTSHHLAISGMHIAVLAGFVYLICRSLFLPPRLATWICLCFVILYGLVALPSPPVVRSVVLCSAFALGLLTRRSLDGIQLLCVSVFLMLIYHPLDLYNAGFQLSFGTVLGLMLFARPALDFVNSFRDRDRLIALSIRKPSPAKAFLLHLRHRLLEGLIAGVVAWAVAAPLVAWHFNQLNPWAIPASLVLAIPVFIALIGGFLKIILTLIFPYLAGTWAMLAAIPIAMMRNMVDLLSRIPGSEAPMPRPAIGLIVLCYLLLALPLLPWPTIRFRRLLRCGPVMACLLIPLLPILPFTPKPLPPGEFRLVLLSVGAGQCIILHLPSGKTLMIDAGSSSSADLSQRCIKPYLKTLGLARIDWLVITHANLDHFSAASEVVHNFKVQQVFLSPYFQEHAVANAPAQAFLTTLNALQRLPTILSQGQRWQLDPDTMCDILWPPASRDLKANESSLVMRITCRKRSILITGDIQEQAERELLNSPDRIRSDVLVAPHHGSSTPTTGQFLAGADPGIILCSNGRSLTQKQREFDRLTTSRARYRTHAYGALSVGISPTGELSLKTFLQPPLSQPSP